MNDGKSSFSETQSSSQTKSQSAVQDEPGRPQTRMYSANEWEVQKPHIRRLYIGQDLPIKEVIARMESEHGFKATSRMYKSRFELWGFSKNVKDKHWQTAAVMCDDREKAGKQTFAFRIHDKKKSIGELKRHIKSRGLTEREFIANARASGVTPSNAIRCITPDPVKTEISSDDSAVKPSTSSDYSFIGSKPEPRRMPKPAKSSKTSRVRRSRGSQDLARPALPAPIWADGMPDLLQDASSTHNKDFSSASTYSLQQAVDCDHLQQDLGFMLIQTVAPEAMSAYPDVHDVGSWGLVSPPDSAAEEKLCPKCRGPSRSHSPVPPDWLWNPSSVLPQRLTYQTLDPSAVVNPDSDDASEFQACCYAACMYGGSEKYDLLAKSLQRANEVFEKMLMENNSMTLLSVLLTLTILHAHNRGSMAESIIRSAYLVACRAIGEGNSVSLTMEWMTAAAGSKLAQCRIKTMHLRAVHTDHQKHFGETHQHTIVSLYCLAFNLIIDKEFAEAETKFAQLSEICSRTLGKRHLQTVSALNGLGRAQTRQGKHELAIVTLKQSLDSHPLGLNHPYRLESLRRLAIIYKKVNEKELAERIYWDVLKGRIKTLGRTHTETDNARSQLEKLLKDMGKWDDAGMMAKKVQDVFDDERATVASDFESIENF